jgi:hypothetical protein
MPLIYTPDDLHDDYELRLDHPILSACAGWFPLHPDRPFNNEINPRANAYRRTDYGATTTPVAPGEYSSSKFYGQKLSIDAAIAPMAPPGAWGWICTMGAWIKIYSPNGLGLGYHGIIGGDNNLATDQYATGPRIFVYDQQFWMTDNLYFATGGFGGGPLIPLNTWTHVVGVYRAHFPGVHYAGGWTYVNGVQVYASDFFPYWANDPAHNDSTVSIGSISARQTAYPTYEAIMNGEIRDAFYSRRWLSPSEIKWLYEQPLDMYVRRSPRVFYNPPFIVPETYSPNLDLPWAEKATYIWALHPSNPLQADKGGNPLVHLSGTETVNAANWLEVTNTRWQSSASFRFGDNPDAGKTVGGVSVWFTTSANSGETQGLVASGNANDAFSLITYENIFLQATLNHSGNNVHVKDLSADPLGFNVPHHVVWQIKADNTAEMWLDGVMVATKTMIYPQVALPSFPFDIATVFGTGFREHQGAIRLVAVVNGDTWTPAEIADQYNNPEAYYGELTYVLIQVAALGSTTVLAPLVVHGTVAHINLAALSSTTILYGLVAVEVEQEIRIAALGSTAVLYALRVIIEPEIIVPALDTTSVLYAIAIFQPDHFPSMIVTTFKTNVVYENVLKVSTSMPEMNASISDLVAGDSRSIRALLTDLPYGDHVIETWLTIKDSIEDLDTAAIIQKNIVPTSSILDGQIKQTDDCFAECIFNLRPIETILLDPGTTYLFDIQIRSMQGAIYTPVKGTIETIQGVTFTN